MSLEDDFDGLFEIWETPAIGAAILQQIVKDNIDLDDNGLVRQHLSSHNSSSDYAL